LVIYSHNAHKEYLKTDHFIIIYIPDTFCTGYPIVHTYGF